ncbi:MAG TPA: MOSC domain-containing protein [Woeseiaceae bacterium]|nr:MOSC domain-containing protein [Woeseiaceae bacterium]
MEQMRLLSVNLGRAETLRHGARSFITGIDKMPTQSAVFVGESGLDNDSVCDLEHHGGPDQAVYAYSANDYAWWSRELGRQIRPGTFGENLTIAEFPDDMNAGDRLLIGDLILEATAPRIPCATFAAQMQDSNFPLRFRHAERPGVYFRVLNAGEIAAGDAVTSAENPAPSVSMLEIFRAWYELKPNADLWQRIVAAPAGIRVRDKFARKLLALDD